jgi:vacuolar-type H+-ATPase subunit B/Vma2
LKFLSFSEEEKRNHYSLILIIILWSRKIRSFQGTWIPHTRLKAELAKQSVAILQAEPRLAMIFTAIGAKGRYFAFFHHPKKEPKTNNQIQIFIYCFLPKLY